MADSNSFQGSSSSAANVKPKKPRKPYTKTRQRELWSDDEHNRFVEALALYERDWKKIEEYVGTKTVIQIRSHAQKYFIKCEKSGETDRIPPPRSKRKRKVGTPNGKDEASSPLSSAAPDKSERKKRKKRNTKKRKNNDDDPAEPTPVAPTRPASRPAPNFARVYSFMSALFNDTASTEMLAVELAQMNETDKETVSLLMHNLVHNLKDSQFRQQHEAILRQFRAAVEYKI